MLGFPFAIIDRIPRNASKHTLILCLSAVMLEHSVLLFSAIHCYKYCINITNSLEESFSSEGNNPRNWSPDV